MHSLGHEDHYCLSTFQGHRLSFPQVAYADGDRDCKVIKIIHINYGTYSKLKNPIQFQSDLEADRRKKQIT